MRVLIVDDEAPARRKLRALLAAEPDVEVVGEAVDGVAAVEQIRRCRPDLVLLDIQMPKLGGFGVVEAVGIEAMPLVIFVTAYGEYALRAFEVHAFDYLTKPFAAARLGAALAHARHRLSERSAADRADELRQVLADVIKSPKYLRRIRAHRGPLREVLVTVDQVVVLRARRNEVELITAQGSYRRRDTLSNLEAQLDPASFARINRSEIVRLDAIRELQPWFRGDYRVILDNGETLSWSRRYRSRAGGVLG